MRDLEKLDVVRDSLALVQAAHFEDAEAVEVLLANANTRYVATFLARVCADLLEDSFSDPLEALADLRDWHTGGR